MPHSVQTFRIIENGLEVQDLRDTTLDTVSIQLPDGTYTTFRTYDHDRVFRLDAQFDRLEESGAFLDRPIHLDRDRLRSALRRILEEVGYPESRIRLTVPLNANLKTPTVYVSIEPFVEVAPDLYRLGIHTVTVTLIRDRPRAKATAFIAPSRRLRQGYGPEIHEALMVNQAGEILEGITSNFFAIRDGVLYTAGEGVLEGITRALVLEVAPSVLPIELRPVHRDQVRDLDEGFITSASREVLPVVSADGQPIGTGQPGPLTLEIHRCFRRALLQQAQKV